MSHQAEIKTVKLSDIIFDEVIYPRGEHDPALVQRYAEVIDEIEAAQKFIAISSDMKLLDGKHRWLAYQKAYGEKEREIRTLVYDVTAPHEQLKLAAKLNSDHGWQLTDEDKEHTAKGLYAYGMSYDEIAIALSVGKTKVSSWLSRTVKENKERRDKKIIDMWQACYTQEEIAEVTSEPVGTVKELLGNGERSLVGKVLENQTNQIAANHLTDFDPPIYNIWKQQEKSNGLNHFGNSEVRWLDNLLYLYTNPLDIVIDPFAGSGSTIDLCKKRFRRYWVGDRLPVPERANQIRQHDITESLPDLKGRWGNVKLVYLDPPYWKQAEGQYSNDATDLANMSLEDFNRTLAGLITDFSKKLTDAYIALIIQPTQWKAPERQYTDHVGDMLRLVKLPVDMRYSVPYESQQCNAQMVDWAKANKKTLVLTREIVVWKTGPYSPEVARGLK